MRSHSPTSVSPSFGAVRAAATSRIRELIAPLRPEHALHDPVLPLQWWIAVDQVLGFHHPTGQWWETTVRGPAERWPWTRAGWAEAWARTIECAGGPLPERGQWQAGSLALRTSRAQFERGVDPSARPSPAGMCCRST